MGGDTSASVRKHLYSPNPNFRTMAVDIYGENQGFPKEVVVPISQNITSPKDVQSPIYQAVYTNPYAAHVPGLRLL